MTNAFAQLMRFFSSQFCFRFVLQFIEHATLGAIELTVIATCSSHSHPFLDLPKGIDRDRSGSGFAIGGVEGVVRGVLMEGGTLLSTLGWTDISDESAQLIHLLVRELLSLHSFRILLLQQVRITIILPLCIADGRGCSME